MKIMSKEWKKLSRAAKNKFFKRWKKADRRKRRAVAFICPDCLRGFCGMCDTGTDADFDRYAVEVQNGYGYYGASGTYVSYGENAI